MDHIKPSIRYHDFRKTLMGQRRGHWLVYHEGNLAVAREANREVDLIGRICRGLQENGRVVLMQKRNAEGVMQYLLRPIVKLLEEDLNEAMILTVPPRG